MKCPTWFCLLFAACAPAAPATNPKVATPPGVPVSVSSVEKIDLPLELRAVGSVEPLAAVMLKPQIAGSRSEVHFDEGQEVHAGDLLLVLDRRPLEAALHAAEANLARDRTLADDAQRNAEQIESALSKKAMSQRSADQARASAAALEAGVAADQAALERAQLELDYASIRAPISGRTGVLLAKQGSALKANETELVSIQQQAPIRVGFSVPERKLPEIRRRQAESALMVTAVIPGDTGAASRGTLSFIDNAVDRTSGTIRLLATFENADRRLWPGQFVQVVLTLAIEHGTLVVPARAVQSGQKGDSVFVVKDDLTVEERSIKVARQAGDWAAISDGLRAGEKVVTEGQLRLVPGVRVDVQANSTPPGPR